MTRKMKVVDSMSKAVGFKITPGDINKRLMDCQIRPDWFSPTLYYISTVFIKSSRLILGCCPDLQIQNKKRGETQRRRYWLCWRKNSIFITEHLSHASKALRAAARSRVRERNYKYFWVRDGKIFVHKDDHSDYILIKDMSSLNRLVYLPFSFYIMHVFFPFYNVILISI